MGSGLSELAISHKRPKEVIEAYVRGVERRLECLPRRLSWKSLPHSSILMFLCLIRVQSELYLVSIVHRLDPKEKVKHIKHIENPYALQRGN